MLFLFSVARIFCAAQAPPVCDHVVLSGDLSALRVAQAYYGLAFEDEITPEEGRKVLLDLTSLLKEYRLSRLGTGEEFNVKGILKHLQQGGYHIQMLPVRIHGRRVLMLHLLDAGHGGDIWRKTYHTMSDGGYYSSRVFVDLATFKIVLIDCNGYG